MHCGLMQVEKKMECMIAFSSLSTHVSLSKHVYKRHSLVAARGPLFGTNWYTCLYVCRNMLCMHERTLKIIINPKLYTRELSTREDYSLLRNCCKNNDG